MTAPHFYPSTKHRSPWHFAQAWRHRRSDRRRSRAGSFPAIAGAGFSAPDPSLSCARDGCAVGNTVYP